jgi:uncharacterized protein (DUF2267 family)
MQRVNEILGERMVEATLATIESAAHFMIATHAVEVARLVGEHADRAEATLAPDIKGGSNRQAAAVI